MRFRISDFGFRIFAALVAVWILTSESHGGDKPKRTSTPKPMFQATVNGHTFSVRMIYGKFDPKKRIVTKRDREPDLVNGKPVLGTDGHDPTPERGEHKPFDTIEKILLRWDGKLIAVPKDMFDHIVLPHRDADLKAGNQPGVMFIPDPSGTALVMVMIVGDGGGLTRVIWLFRKDGKHRTLDTEFLQLSN